MKYFAKHTIHVLDILSAPFGLPSIQIVKNEARQMNQDKGQLLAHYAGVICQDVMRVLSEGVLEHHCLVVDTLFLDPWAKLHLDLITFPRR